jgi:dTDP-4-dehydrorhamnose 3,5-epimerase-like enzyme
MEENITIVFHGFLNLSAKEKLKLVEAINEYFDSNDRDPIRENNETKFSEIDWNSSERKCKCCGR